MTSGHILNPLKMYDFDIIYHKPYPAAMYDVYYLF